MKIEIKYKCLTTLTYWNIFVDGEYKYELRESVSDTCSFVIAEVTTKLNIALIKMLPDGSLEQYNIPSNHNTPELKQVIHHIEKWSKINNL